MVGAFSAMQPCMREFRRWTLLGALAVAGVWGGCTGDIGDAGGPSSVVPPASEMGVGPAGIRRLSVFELDLTLLDLLGDDTRPGLTLLPEDTSSPFDNDFLAQNPSRVHVDAFESIGIDVSTRLLSDAGRRDQIVGCTPTGVDDSVCMQSFVESFGLRAFRRPLTADESTDFLDLATTWATQDNDFYSGVDVVVRSVIQSAAFLYRVEIGTPVTGQSALFQLDAYEIASRMSYLIWGSMPDGALLDDASSDLLLSVDGRRAAAARMLDDSRALRQVDRFHAMWLGYQKMPLPADLTASMRVETNALIDRVVFDQRGSWLDLFTATETFVDANLAAHYGLAAPADASGDWVPFGDRLGILSQGAFLSAASNPGDTSPTKRGKLIRNRLMCQIIPPPPPGVSIDQPPGTGTNECKWDAYEANRNSGSSCAGCHDQMDLVGFGLENYNMQGQFRATDDGKPQCVIEGKGEFAETGEAFNGPAGLSTMLVDSGLLGACMVEHLMQFAIGRELKTDDEALVSMLAESFEETDHRFHELVVAIVGADAFGFRLEMPAN
jgi:hypothetical protein